MAGSFETLNIWQKGYELLMRVYQVTAHYPIEERYGLVTDTRRSANSIIANIAEAHGRFYFADKIRVLYQARGEVEEIRSHLKVGYGLKFLTEEEFLSFDKEYEGLSVGISSYIKFLGRSKRNLNQNLN